MTGADRESNDPCEPGTQLRAGLWHTINERYPGSMIEKYFVPLARSRKPLSQARLTLISSCGVHSKSDLTRNFCSFIGYNMDPEKFEHTVAHGVAEAVAMEEEADGALLVPA